MSKIVMVPVGEVDPATIWAPLDRLIRELLPSYLEHLGFAMQAVCLRALEPITEASGAEHMRALERHLRTSIFLENCKLADRTRALCESGADDLEVLHARRSVYADRFEHAPLYIGLVLGVAAQSAASTALAPGPWPAPRVAAAIAMREIRACTNFFSSVLDNSGAAT